MISECLSQFICPGALAIDMVYDWDDKRDACYRLYVVEKRNLDEVMKFFKDEGVFCHGMPAWSYFWSTLTSHSLY